MMEKKPGWVVSTIVIAFVVFFAIPMCASTLTFLWLMDLPGRVIDYVKNIRPDWDMVGRGIMYARSGIWK